MNFYADWVIFRPILTTTSIPFFWDYGGWHTETAKNALIPIFAIRLCFC